MAMKDDDVKRIALVVSETLRQTLKTGQPDSEWQLANEPFKTEVEKKEEKFHGYVSKPTDTTKTLKQEVFVTGTVLDKLYLGEDNKPLNGLPIVGQFGIVGLSGVGKSILAQEIAVRVAASGKKVVYVTSEDIWSSPNPRFDLEARLKQKTTIMKLDWEKVKANLFVLDTITYTELREWETLVETYRWLVETQKGIDLLIVDSLTLLEAYRGALKYRVLELCRYNQIHGITGIYVSQRSEEETDRFAMAGGMGVAHNLDSVICIDFAKAMGQLKDDLGKKQWENTHFLRILSCRLSGFNRKYFECEITQDGFLGILLVDVKEEK